MFSISILWAFSTKAVNYLRFSTGCKPLKTDLRQPRTIQVNFHCLALSTPRFRFPQKFSEKQHFNLLRFESGIRNFSNSMSFESLFTQSDLAIFGWDFSWWKLKQSAFLIVIEWRIHCKSVYWWLIRLLLLALVESPA